MTPNKPTNPFAAITDSPIRRPSIPLFPWVLWVALFIGNVVVLLVLQKFPFAYSRANSAWGQQIQNALLGWEPLVISAVFLLHLYSIPRLWHRP